jgi:VanZ family protein
MREVERIIHWTAIIYWLITLGYMGIIFYLSTIKLPISLSLPNNSDKVIHFCTYATLAFLSYISFRKSGVSKYLLLLSFFFVTLYGIINEVYQSYVPGRDASFGDIIANSFGALFGSYLANTRGRP